MRIWGHWNRYGCCLSDMNFFKSILVLAFAFLAVFGEATLSAPRAWLGAQIDLLPALMVYAALNTGLSTVATLAVLGGVWFDTLSENPLGISILPLFLVGWLVQLRRDLILRDLTFAQFVLGTAASGLVPLLALLMMLSSGKELLLGWGSIWQWLVMTVVGGAATPFIFRLIDWFNRRLGYAERVETSFRLDREIHRGRQ